MSKMARLSQHVTLLWGCVVGLSALGGCAGHTKPVAATNPPASNPAPTPTTEPAGVPDYATKLAEWVQAHQPEAADTNTWQEFVDVVTQASGAWDYYKLSDEHMSKFIAVDPDTRWPAAEPNSISDDPVYAQFIPDLRAFFSNFDRSQLMIRLDALIEHHAFIASRSLGPLTEVLMPELGHARMVGKLCSARMHLAALDGDMTMFDRALRHEIAVIQAVQGRGVSMSALLAYALIANAESRVRRETLEGRLRPDAIAAATLALRGVSIPDLRVVAGGERFFTLDAIDRVFDAAGNEAAPGNPAARKAVDQGFGVLAPREEQLALANRLYDGWMGAFSDDPAERERGGKDVDAVLAIVDAKNGKMYAPLSIVIPSLGKLRGSDLAARTRHDGTLVMLALETYRARVGHYPEKLEDLVPADLDRVPIDRYAPGTTLRYHLLDAHSADPAKAYILYSVGLDGADDGGKKHPVNNYNAANRVGKGFDFILNCVD